MKYDDIQLGDKVGIYKNMGGGLVKVVGKSPPETIIVERENGKRHFVPCGKIKRPKFGIREQLLEIVASALSDSDVKPRVKEIFDAFERAGYKSPNEIPAIQEEATLDERKKWVKAFMEAGALVADSDDVAGVIKSLGRAAVERVASPMIEYLNEQIQRNDEGKQRMETMIEPDAAAERAIKAHIAIERMLKRILSKFQSETELLGEGDEG